MKKKKIRSKHKHKFILAWADSNTSFYRCSCGEPKTVLDSLPIHPRLRV